MPLSSYPRSAGSTPEHASLHDEITSSIVAEMEAGRLPWVQPWGSSGVSGPLAMPKNAATGRSYSGINVLILWEAVVARERSGAAPGPAQIPKSPLAGVNQFDSGAE